MPKLTKEECSVLKAQVFDLDERAAKQVLYGVITVLSERVSLMSGVFNELVEDGVRYSNCREKRERICVGLNFG